MSATSVADVATPPPVARAQGWWADARCREDGADVAAFFSQLPRDIARAKRVCAVCPVMTPCLAGALERAEPWGVWGGQLFDHGRIVATKRPRGRPRNVPRPEDQLPEVPIPAPLRHLALVHTI